MKILFIGDVFGRPGRRLIGEWLPNYRAENHVDFVIANAENSAGGKGITNSTVDELLGYKIEVLTGGNHTWNHRDSHTLLANDERLLRPANVHPQMPGRGLGFYTARNGARIAVLNLMGRAFMKPIDCPFRAAEELAEEALAETPILFVDFHAEATSEKMAMAAYLDGKATAVIGTHTHVPTADVRVTPAGTAAITDVGMSGPFNSVIGVKTDIILDQMITGMFRRHEVAAGDTRVCALLVELDPATGRATKAEGVHHPEFASARAEEPAPEG